jgi:hypothetical protein
MRVVRVLLWWLPALLIVAAVIWGTQLPSCADFLDGPCSPSYDPIPPLALFALGVIGIVVEAVIWLPRKSSATRTSDVWKEW